MIRLLRFLYFYAIVKPIMSIVLGLNVRHRERLPRQGPAIIAANHNSHLDTMALITLLPRKLLPIIRPVAAMDYFMRKRSLAWFALNIIGIIPIKRTVGRGEEDPLAPCYDALASGSILIFFPEGTRGEPERLAAFKGGTARLAEKFPEVPVFPVLLHGLGKALPRGEALLVPVFCDVFIGEPLYCGGDRREFMHELEQAMKQLADEGHFPPWE